MYPSGNNSNNHLAYTFSVIHYILSPTFFQVNISVCQQQTYFFFPKALSHHSNSYVLNREFRVGKKTQPYAYM